MTTLIMEFPANAANVISKIIKQAQAAGASIHLENDDDLCAGEFELIKESYREALSIKNGTTKPIPASDLWNE